MIHRFSRALGIATSVALAVAVTLPARAAAPVAPAGPSVATLAFPRVVSQGSLHTLVEADQGALVGGVQIFLAAGLDRETHQQSGLASLVAESIVRSPACISGASTCLCPQDAAPAVPATGITTDAPRRVRAGRAVATAEDVPAPGAPAVSTTTVSSAIVRTAPVESPASIRSCIAASGGLLEYTVDGRSVHFYVEGPGARLGAFVRAFGAVLAKPSFTPEIVDGARAALSRRATDLENSALSVGVQMFRRAYYVGGPGEPALGSSASLATFTSHDVLDFYTAHYLRDGVTATAVGAIGTEVHAALDDLASSLPSGTVPPVTIAVRPIPETATRIVSRRDVGAPQVVVGFAAPSPQSPDFGTALVLEALLSDAFERPTATTLPQIEHAISADYLYDTAPASIIVYVNGARIDPSIGLRGLILVTRSLARQPLNAATFARYKAAAAGMFVTGSTTLADRSYLLGTLAAQGLGTDAINAALASIAKATPADLQRVAKRYLQRFLVSLVLPRSSTGGA